MTFSPILGVHGSSESKMYFGLSRPRTHERHLLPLVGQQREHVVSGWGPVGRAVTSVARDPLFKSCHWQILFSINCIKNVLKSRK